MYWLSRNNFDGITSITLWKEEPKKVHLDKDNFLYYGNKHIDTFKHAHFIELFPDFEILPGECVPIHGFRVIKNDTFNLLDNLS